MTKHRLIAVGAAAAMAFLSSTTFARVIINDGFEDGSRSSYVSSGEGDFSVVTNYVESAQPSALAPYPFSETGTGTGSDGFGSKYLFVDSDTNVLWRTFGTTSSDVYLDAYTQFTTSESEVEYDPTAKIAIYLDANTNLCVISGTSESVRTPVTNILATASSIQPGTWHRVTLAAKAGSVFAFNIYLDGTLLTASVGGASTFYSLTSGEATSSGFGVMGTGALDDVVVRTTDPFASAAATINGESYASLEDALAESNGATITLAGNHAAVGVSTPGTYVIDAGSYTFGGLVGLGGAIVSASPSGSVTTYTVVAPVAVWDGASSLYNFSTLTRTFGDTTYTLNSSANASIHSGSDYIEIGSANDQKTATITADREGAFGTDGKVTVIIKCSNMNLGDNYVRGLIGLLSGSDNSDNNIKIGIATRWNASYSPAGKYSAYIKDNTVSTYSENSAPWTTDEQTACIAYDSSYGTEIYRNGSLIASKTEVKSEAWTTPTGIVLGGVDKDGSKVAYAQNGMKIQAVAVFKTKLTAAQIAAYAFPSEISPSADLDATMSVIENTPVSTINSVLGDKSEIWLDVADGVTVTGDVAFVASTVHFYSKGEVIVYPPTGNAATLDFATTANPVVAYNNVIPSKNGSVFTANTVPTWVTDSTRWTNTVWIKNKSGITAANFNLNDFGNEKSTVRLTKVRGYLKAKQNTSVLSTTYSPAIELFDDGEDYALYLDNGYSYTGSYNEYTIFRELKGSGTLIGANSAEYVLLNVQKWDDFTGTLSLTNKVVAFGSTIPAAKDFKSDTSGVRKGGLIYVMSGATVEIAPEKKWYAANNDYKGGAVIVEGEMKTGELLERLTSDTKVFLLDTGKLTLIATSDIKHGGTDYSSIKGTGTLRLESRGNYFRVISQKNLASTLAVEVELQNSLAIPNPNVTNVIGSLSGTKNIRTDWSSGNRWLKILQAKDTEWEGIFANDDRLNDFIVAPGASSAGTLTLSGTQDHTNGLVVASGANVKLTGTWVGATTVNGSLTGTGTIDGNVTLSDGATIKVEDLASSRIRVTGNVTASAGEVNVNLPAGTTASDNLALMSATGDINVSGATFKVYVGDTDTPRKNMKVVVRDGTLKVISRGSLIRFD